jgi:dihydrofolate synthase/folylpolyglutamate synthase
MLLQEFLESKPLFYREIDYTRMPRIYQKVKKYLNPHAKIIHLVGTNGKGTTGRFLATALFNNGYKTAHYSSPHILKFNERIWLDGCDVSDEILDSSHLQLCGYLSKDDADSLSYFEYTTLLAMLIFKDSEYIVLEAGLGGEFDATAVFKSDLTLVTPIDFDHQSFLGDDIKTIATTKLNAISCAAILAKQKHQDVYQIAKDISKKKNLTIKRVDQSISIKDDVKLKEIQKNLNLFPYLFENLKLSVAALNFFKVDYKVDDFKGSKLFGRVSKISENIILDVGHNPLAASSIVKDLQGEKYILIYNTYKDKEYKKILEILKPIIESVQIISIDDDRMINITQLYTTLKDLKIKYSKFNKIEMDKNYLVFGSFRVIEEFLKGVE